MGGVFGGLVGRDQARRASYFRAYRTAQRTWNRLASAITISHLGGTSYVHLTVWMMPQPSKSIDAGSLK